MLIGAYRTTRSMPPIRWRQAEVVKNAGAQIEEITLRRGQRHLAQLIADALRCEPERAAPLAHGA